MGHDWAIIPIHSLWLFFPISLYKLSNQLVGSRTFKWWQSKNVLKKYQWPTKLHYIYMLKFLWRFFYELLYSANTSAIRVYDPGRCTENTSLDFRWLVDQSSLSNSLILSHFQACLSHLQNKENEPTDP